MPGVWFPLKTVRLDGAAALAVRQTLHFRSSPGVTFEIEDSEEDDEWIIRAVLDVKPHVIGAYASNETIAGAAVTGEWQVIAEFELDVKFEEMVLDALVLVSDPTLTANLRIMNTPVGDAPSLINGSEIETQADTGERLISDDIGSGLIVGQRYQIQAECIGGADPEHFAIVRYAQLRAL